MARTHVQQSQISGSLSVTGDSYSEGSGLTIAENRTLVDDLNDLRKQVRRIIGSDSWSSALSGSQDLADIWGAMVVAGPNADFQGTLDVTGVATFDAAITGSAGMQLAGDLDVNSSADFQGAVNMQSTLDVAGAMDVAGQVDLAAVGVATNVRGTLDVAENATFTSITGSAGLKVDGDADFNSTADFAAAVNMQSTLNVSGKADFAGIVDVASTLSASAVKIDGDVVGRLYLVGSEGEIQDSDKMSFDGSLFQLTGSADISNSLTVGNGLSVLAGGLTVAGDSMEITGSFTVVGASAFSGSVSIEGDVAKRLYIVDGDGSIKDEEKLTFDGSELLVTGSAKLSSNLTVEGGSVTLSNSVSMASSAANKLVITASDMVEVSGDLKVGGDTIKSSTADAIELSGANVEVKGDLTVSGNDIKSATDTVITMLGKDATFAQDLTVSRDLFAVSGSFTGDVTVSGDLLVQGKMTYIETDNLKIKDTLIHLNVGGGSSTSPRGIVLHGNQAFDDLALGAAANSGDFVFAKKVDDADVDSANNEIFAVAELAAAKMSSVMLGGAADGISGSLSYSAGDISLSASNDLLLSANGETAISFIEASEYSAFNAQFPGMSLVAAIVAAGGNFKQGSFKPGDKAIGASIDYSSVGALRAASYATEAAKKLAMDVYLNGVRLAYTDDYAIDGSGVLTLAMATMADDVLTVVIHNAA